MDITDLYISMPRYTVAKTYITQLPTADLLALKESIDKQIKTISISSSLLSLPFEIYTTELNRVVKKLLKQRAREEKTSSRPRPFKWL